MVAEITMPQVSDSTDPVKIVSWKISEGSAVKAGQVIAEVETDKATIEIESFVEGEIARILVPAGQGARPGQVIAQVGGTDRQPSGETGDEESDDENGEIESAGMRLRVSPLAKRLAREHGIDLASIKGSGPEGRIVRIDIETALANQAAGQNADDERPAAASEAPQAEPAEEMNEEKTAGGTLVPLSKMRAAIARRMQQSKSEAPHFYTTISINMDNAQQLRDTLRKKPEFKGISVNHLIIKAAGYALGKEPRVNRAMRGERMFVPDHINVGFVAAIDDGLFIPVLKDTDKATLQQIVVEARAATERAKAGKPSATDLVGGTFSISNMGMYDVENFTAIISPGQGAILSVSAIQDQAIVKNGQIAIAPMMKATLAVDHRVIDGVMTCIFLKHFKEALETPALLLI